MIAAILAAANRLDSIAPVFSTAPGAELEAWVLLELGAALADLKLPVTIQPEVSGLPALKKIVLRSSQHSPLYTHGHTWLEITGRRRTYHILNAVPLRGASGASHEMDVCVISPSTRANGTPSLLAGLECKQTYPQKNAFRAVIGWVVDLRAYKKIYGLISTVDASAESKDLASFYRIRFEHITLAKRGHAGIRRLANSIAARIA